MDKLLGLSYYEHNYNLSDIGLYDYKNQSEYGGIFVLKDEKNNLSFDDFRDYYELLIPVNDDVFEKISKLSKLEIIKYNLNIFLMEYNLEEWMI
jgi:hypothetical protein